MMWNWAAIMLAPFTDIQSALNSNHAYLSKLLVIATSHRCLSWSMPPPNAILMTLAKIEPLSSKKLLPHDQAHTDGPHHLLLLLTPNAMVTLLTKPLAKCPGIFFSMQLPVLAFIHKDVFVVQDHTPLIS